MMTSDLRAFRAESSGKGVPSQNPKDSKQHPESCLEMMSASPDQRPQCHPTLASLTNHGKEVRMVDRALAVFAFLQLGPVEDP
jgi:hypothetical protein